MSSPSYARLGVGLGISVLLLAALAKASSGGGDKRVVRLDDRTYQITKFSDPNHFKLELLEKDGTNVRAFVEFNRETTLGAGGSFPGIKQVIEDSPRLALMDPFAVREG